MKVARLRNVHANVLSSCLSVPAHARSAIFRLQLQYFVSITNLQDMLDNLDLNVFSSF